MTSRRGSRSVMALCLLAVAGPARAGDTAGRPDAADVARRLQAPDPDVRRAARDDVAAWGGRRFAVRTLEPHGEVEADAAEERLAGAFAVVVMPVLLEQMTSADVETRRGAADAATAAPWLHTSSFGTHLARAVASDDPVVAAAAATLVREGALRGLISAADRPAWVERVVARIGGPDEATGKAAAGAAAGLGAAGVDALVRVLLAGSDLEAERCTGAVCGCTVTAADYVRLVERAVASSGGRRESLVDAVHCFERPPLGAAALRSVQAGLATLLADPVVRRFAMAAVEGLGAEAAGLASAIEPLLDDPDEAVRAPAFRVLFGLGPTTATPGYLVQGLASRSYGIRRSAAEAVSVAAGTPEVRRALQAALAVEDAPGTRRALEAALARLAEVPK